MKYFTINLRIFNRWGELEHDILIQAKSRVAARKKALEELASMYISDLENIEESASYYHETWRYYPPREH